MADDEQQSDQQRDSEELAPGADGAAALPRTVEGGMRLQFALDMPILPKFDSLKDWSHQALINAALIGAIGLIVLVWLYGHFVAAGTHAATVTDGTTGEATGPVMPNIASEYNPTADTPEVPATAFVDATAEVVGNIVIGTASYIGPNVVIDSWAGQPMHLGSDVNIQAGTAIGARPTFVRGHIDDSALVEVNNETFAIYVGDKVTIGPGVQITGPTVIQDEAYVGQGAIITNASIGTGAVVEPGAIIAGVEVPEGRYVPAGTPVLTQAQADELPEIDASYPMASAGKDAVAYFTALAKALAENSPAMAGEGAAAD